MYNFSIYLCIRTQSYRHLPNKWCIMEFLTTYWLMPSQSLCSASLPLPTLCSSTLLAPVIKYGIYLWPVWVGCPDSVPSLSILCLPYWQDSMRSTETETPLAMHSTAQQQLKHQCIINTVLFLKPNYSIISDNMKKISSVSNETRTEADSWSHLHRW